MLRRIHINLLAGFLDIKINVKIAILDWGNFGQMQYFTQNKAIIGTFGIILTNMIMWIPNLILFFTSTSCF